MIFNFTPKQLEKKRLPHLKRKKLKGFTSFKNKSLGFYPGCAE